MPLQQPLRSQAPEPGHAAANVITLARFIELLRIEEDYYPREQDKTDLMITRLRKIFYNTDAWDDILIRPGSKTPGRFETVIVKCPPGTGGTTPGYVSYQENNQCVKVMYMRNDRVYGNTRDRQIPEIWVDDHADVRLPDGYHCDIGHVLAGLDARQNHHMVMPRLDTFAMEKDLRAFPYATNNCDVCTWLGDIATSAANFLFEFVDHGGQLPGEPRMQQIIDQQASASDMMGNIDSYVIYHYWRKKMFQSKRVSGMLEEYYGNVNLFKDRYVIFTEQIKLGKLQGGKFSNEVAWLDFYEKELRATISFMIYAFGKADQSRVELALQAWLRAYEQVIQIRRLLKLFLDALKNVM